MSAVISPPSGTVTFLFTDIEGSTRLWEGFPAEMSLALEQHDEIVRACAADSGGYVFSTAGDSFAVAYAKAGDAVASAQAIQSRLAEHAWPGGLAIRVRMGLHTGQSNERGGDYFGPSVNKAARIMAAAHGSQVLLSEVTASLTEDVSLVDLGPHRLKDLQAEVGLWQVGAARHPPPRTLSAARHNLPVQRTEIFGREAEVGRVSDWLAGGRLVSVVGSGGIGKTRLAVAAGGELVDRFPAGVFFVDLSPVRDPSLIPQAVARATSMSLDGVASSRDEGLEFVAGAVAGRELLLILDNCEHVIDAVADFVDAVMDLGSAARVLATSREALDLEGERVLRVSSLEISAGTVAPAVQLFVERATAGGAVVDPEDPAVERLCGALDGLPLAIELAAAQSLTFTPQELLDRLDDRFELLSTRRRRRAGGRQRTLSAVLDWSWDLLSTDERELLAQLSVFRATWAMSDAEVVCASEASVAALVQSLNAKSLVESMPDEAGVTSFRLLESIRIYAASKLEAAQASEVHARHGRHFALIASALSEDDRYLAYPALSRFDSHQADIRAALDHAVETSEHSTAAGALYSLGQLFLAGLAHPTPSDFSHIDGVVALGIAGSEGAVVHQAAANAAAVAHRAEAAAALARTAGRMARAAHEPLIQAEAIVIQAEPLIVPVPSRADDLLASAVNALDASTAPGHHAILLALQAHAALVAGTQERSTALIDEVLENGRPDGYEVTLATISAATEHLSRRDSARAASLLAEHRELLMSFELDPWWMRAYTAGASFASGDLETAWDHLEVAFALTSGAEFALADMALACAHHAVATDNYGVARALLTAMRSMPVHGAMTHAQQQHLMRVVPRQTSRGDALTELDLRATLTSSLQTRALTPQPRAQLRH